MKLNNYSTCKTPVFFVNSVTKTIGGKINKISIISMLFSADEKNFHPYELMHSA